MSAATAGQRFFRALGAAPDAATALWCLWVWIAPRVAGVHWVKQVIVAMLLEFLVLHSSGFFNRFMGTPEAPWRRASMGLLLALLYLALAAGFSAIFDTWWPLVGVAWLLGMRYWTLVLDRELPEQEAVRQMGLWAASLIFFVGGGVLTAFLPLPALGIGDDVRSELELPGSGLWISEPHRPIAFAVLYFGLLALVKYRYHPADARPRDS